MDSGEYAECGLLQEIWRQATHLVGEERANQRASRGASHSGFLHRVAVGLPQNSLPPHLRQTLPSQRKDKLLPTRASRENGV